MRACVLSKGKFKTSVRCFKYSQPGIAPCESESNAIRYCRGKEKGRRGEGKGKTEKM